MDAPGSVSLGVGGQWGIFILPQPGDFKELQASDVYNQRRWELGH